MCIHSLLNTHIVKLNDNTEENKNKNNIVGYLR